jgi:hypothetical protein
LGLRLPVEQKRAQIFVSKPIVAGRRCARLVRVELVQAL